MKFWPDVIRCTTNIQSRLFYLTYGFPVVRYSSIYDNDFLDFNQDGSFQNMKTDWFHNQSTNCKNMSISQLYANEQAINILTSKYDIQRSTSIDYISLIISCVICLLFIIMLIIFVFVYSIKRLKRHVSAICNIIRNAFVRIFEMAIRVLQSSETVDRVVESSEVISIVAPTLEMVDRDVPNLEIIDKVGPDSETDLVIERRY